MKKPILAILAFLSVIVIAQPALAIQSVTADANSSDTTGAHFTGDFVLTVADGTNTGSTSVTTATHNTGSLSFAGVSTVAGTVGTDASVQIKGISAGAAAKAVTFGGNVFAVTTTVQSTGTINFNGNVTGTTLHYNGDGTVNVADDKNLTLAITTATNNTGSLTLAGTSTVSGQVGASGTALKLINAGTAGEAATFSSDVFATTTSVTSTGTVNFNGSLTGTTLNFAGNGTVNVADGKNLVVSDVTTSGNNTGSVVFSGTSTISSAMGANGGNDLNRVISEGGIVTLNTTSDGSAIQAYEVTTTTVRTNTATGSSGTFTIGENRNAAGSQIVGSVFVNSASATQQSTFDAGQYTSVVTGDFEIAANSILKTTIVSTGASSSTAGHVIASTVSDDARVAASSTLNINATPGAYVANGQTFMIVDGEATGTNVNAPTTIVDNSATLSFTTANTGNDLTATAVRANMSTLATDSNSSAIGSTLNGFSTGATGDMATVIANLDTLPTAQAFSDAVNQLDPDMNGGINQASFNSTGGALNTVSTRMDNARNGIVAGGGQNGISSGDEFTDAAIWMQGFGVYGDQDNKDGIAGYTATTWGAAGGLDWKLNERTRLGASFAYSNSEVESNDETSSSAAASTTDIDGYQGTIYGGYEGDPWYLEGMFAFGWNAYDGSRTIRFASIDRTAAQDYDGQQYSTKWTFGYPIPLADRWDLVPIVSLLYSHLNIDGFTETGAGALNLTVEDQSYDFLQQGLGAKIVTEHVDGNNQKWVPSFHAMWLYDYIGDRASSTSTFAGGGSSFTTNGLEPEQSSLNAGAGLTVYPNDSLSLSIGYDFEYRSDYTGHSGSATARYEF